MKHKPNSGQKFGKSKKDKPGLQKSSHKEKFVKAPKIDENFKKKLPKNVVKGVKISDSGAVKIRQKKKMKLKAAEASKLLKSNEVKIENILKGVSELVEKKKKKLKTSPISTSPPKTDNLKKSPENTTRTLPVISPAAAALLALRPKIKSKSMRRRLKKKLKNPPVEVQKPEPPEVKPVEEKKVKTKKEKFHNSKNSSLRERMLARLSAAQFRYLNEELYTWDGQETPSVFSKDPKSFKAYHDGFKQQTKLWPINPIDLIIKSIKQLPNFQDKTIADFGCGEAKLSLELNKNKVFSFDLVALNDRVTVADNSNTKLFSKTVDIAVHCLSLMSSNISGYVKEANRVLKVGGILKIAEVESRFEDVDKFVENVCKFNFKLVKKDLSHDLFYFIDFEKLGDIGVARKRKLPSISLQPCLYKKR